MNIFKKIFGKVKEVVTRIFKPKNPVAAEVDKIIDAASNPPETGVSVGWSKEGFEKALQKAIDSGETFYGAEEGLLKGDAFQYPRVESWLEMNGYYEDTDTDGGLE